MPEASEFERALPETVRIIEVGPRDGFQAERNFIPTEHKIDLIERLADAGLKEIEATSFVHSRVILQMADAAEVMARVHQRADVRWIALVPNLVGAQRAIAAGADELRLVVCCTETYNQRNVGLSIDQSVERFRAIVEFAANDGRDSRGDATPVAVSAVLGVAFGCPFEGDVPIAKVVGLAGRFAELGAHAIGLADSAGLGNPLQARRLVTAVRERIGSLSLWLHLHDTRGLGLANALSAMECGVDTFDTAFAGLGGCPIMKGASGNIATEDFAYMCSEMGIETGVDLDRLRAASRRIQSLLGRDLPSRVLSAGTRDELEARNRQDAGSL